MQETIKKIEFTEEEAIRITMEHGYDGAEFNTSVWKTRGCLHPNRTLDALISKLKTIYDSVEVEGKGKKRKYILKDKKVKVSERIFNYKGTIPTLEDDIMKEFIFNHLVSYEKEFTQSYRGWARLIGFIGTDNFKVEEMIQKLKNVHHGFPTIYNPKEAVGKFIQTLNIRNKDVVEKSFKRLEKEGRITVSEVYNFKMNDGQIEEVDQLEYEEVQEVLKELLESKEVTYYQYTQSVTSLNKSKKMKEIIREVGNYLSEQFDIQYFFKSFKVTVLDKTIHNEISKDEFKQAYFKRLIKLSIDRQNKKDYKESLSFWKRFYLLNTLALLKYLNVKGIEKYWDNERKLQLEKTDEFTLERLIYYFESDVEKEKIRHTFGNIDNIEESLPF
ncbi:hypothetical protein [Bacillus benzoevorans]|uniref:Uncharacterized protein n=1 Tax=Bacillus benzoevorans TaxID=1456 RepID=A0A7X0HRM7_9BACI|nr:hypothetical protein [Bacillus benzoevorans]MBB6445624.1 hypothetical protein [Bacillus benzoevorans]